MFGSRQYANIGGIGMDDSNDSNNGASINNTHKNYSNPLMNSLNTLHQFEIISKEDEDQDGL